MFRFWPSRLYTTRYSINNRSGAERLDTNRRKLSRYPRRQTGVGQNLSERYLRLEKSLRGREALSKELDGYSHNSSSIQSNPLSKSSPKPLQKFRGFEIPEEPKPPADDECCMSGCAVCVYDLHEEAVNAYKEAVLSLQNSLSALHIPMDEWPSSIRLEPSGLDKRREMVLGAFEEMERALKLKRQSEAEAQAQARIKAKRNQLIPKKVEFSLGQAFAQLYEALRWMFANL